jgi:hypothetical protein
MLVHFLCCWNSNSNLNSIVWILFKPKTKIPKPKPYSKPLPILPSSPTQQQACAAARLCQPAAQPAPAAVQATAPALRANPLGLSAHLARQRRSRSSPAPAEADLWDPLVIPKLKPSSPRTPPPPPVSERSTPPPRGPHAKAVRPAFISRPRPWGRPTRAVQANPPPFALAAGTLARVPAAAVDSPDPPPLRRREIA